MSVCHQHACFYVAELVCSAALNLPTEMFTGAAGMVYLGNHRLSLSNLGTGGGGGGFAVTLWLKHRTLYRENPGSNPFAAVSEIWQFRSLHFVTVQTAVNDYLATESGGYVNE